ncbi:RHS repeat-associated core domain-containing protein [Pseudomonas sp. NPDC087336]|uniref:RHS repeat-associated core domain-containing protein n=1 Tax=Pseudomonas sp. NPDC087336 TaxID=3364436 RepID=UPI0038039FCA
MTTTPLQKVLCHYRYDALDRSITWTPDRQAGLQRFFCKDRLATEIHNAAQRSIFQQDEHVLAQQNRWGDKVDTTLLATDHQRSVLNAMDSTQAHRIAYTPYGHRPLASGLLSLLGFNGERPDLVTGHYHLGNGYRQFNPVLMRFNSPDKLSPFGKGGVNAYAYCGNDPINWIDPDGSLRIIGIGKINTSTYRANVIARDAIAGKVTITNGKATILFNKDAQYTVDLAKHSKRGQKKIVREAVHELESGRSSLVNAEEQLKYIKIRIHPKYEEAFNGALDNIKALPQTELEYDIPPNSNKNFIHNKLWTTINQAQINRDIKTTLATIRNAPEHQNLRKYW